MLRRIEVKPGSLETDFLRNLSFDLDLDPEIWAAYKKKHNFRHSGTPTSAHLANDILELFFANPNSPEFTYSFFRQAFSPGTQKAAILHAHGASVNGIWSYGTNGLVTPVQQWISAQSGTDRYGVIIISCCNEQKSVPISTNVPVFFAEGILGNKYKHKTRFLEGSKV